MKISIVIPTLNAGPLFKEVLDAIRSQELSDPVELVIVDSMSEDGTEELAKKYADVFFQVKREEFNHGGTRNLAISRSSGELIALLVQDATPADKNWLKNLANAFKDPGVAGAFSRQIPRPDCNPLIRLRLRGWASANPERRVREGIPEVLSQPTGSMPRKLTPEQIRDVIASLSFDNVSSMIRRSVWEEVKFPERKFAEDIAWAKMVLEKGFKIVYEPESAVIHSHNKSLWYEFKRIYLDHQNWWEVAGFRIFNRKRELVSASISGTFRTILALREENLSGGGFIYWSLYTPFYIFSQNLAQYMGSWSIRWKGKYKWYKIIDERISRGV